MVPTRRVKSPIKGSVWGVWEPSIYNSGLSQIDNNWSKIFKVIKSRI